MSISGVVSSGRKIHKTLSLPNVSLHKIARGSFSDVDNNVIDEAIEILKGSIESWD